MDFETIVPLSPLELNLLECSEQEGSLPEIPMPSGDFLDMFLRLKDQAYEFIMETGATSTRRRRLRGRAKYGKVSGFLAFKSFYQREFYSLPMVKVVKFIAKLWRGCPDKTTWEYYAAEYSKHRRTEPFLDWLFKTQKTSANNFVPFVMDTTHVKQRR